MTAPPLSRQRCAQLLVANADRLRQLRAFVGLDGFVDEIAHVVDKRLDSEAYQRIETITHFSQRIGAAAGHSTNIELVPQQIKLGGNGPIMANALACLGLQVTYLGALGYPQLHPAFQEFSQLAQVHSIAEPGQTTALEFSDGKIMLVRGTLNDVRWHTIATRFGIDPFLNHVRTSDLVAFVNWTELPHLEEIWRNLREKLGTPSSSQRQLLFIDLADPEKRASEELGRALQLLGTFESHFEVVLGLNEKEARQVAAVAGLDSSADLSQLVPALRTRLTISQLLVHPVSYALLATPECLVRQDGPRVERPVLTTGGGDHFNAGYCLGQLLALGPEASLLYAVATSGFYVGHGRSPSLQNLIDYLGSRDWDA